jgi:hypothetical protein
MSVAGKRVLLAQLPVPFNVETGCFGADAFERSLRTDGRRLVSSACPPSPVGLKPRPVSDRLGGAERAPQGWLWIRAPIRDRSYVPSSQLTKMGCPCRALRHLGDGLDEGLGHAWRRRSTRRLGEPGRLAYGRLALDQPLPFPCRAKPRHSRVNGLPA